MDDGHFPAIRMPLHPSTSFTFNTTSANAAGDRVGVGLSRHVGERQPHIPKRRTTFVITIRSMKAREMPGRGYVIAGRSATLAA